MWLPLALLPGTVWFWVLELLDELVPLDSTGGGSPPPSNGDMWFNDTCSINDVPYFLKYHHSNICNTEHNDINKGKISPYWTQVVSQVSGIQKDKNWVGMGFLKTPVKIPFPGAVSNHTGGHHTSTYTSDDVTLGFRKKWIICASGCLTTWSSVSRPVSLPSFHFH